MRAQPYRRADSSGVPDLAAPILIDIDWARLVGLVTRATTGAMHVLECDRLTTAFGPDVRVTTLVPRRILENLAMLGLEPNRGALTTHGGAALSARDCEMTGRIDPLAANVRRALDVHGRSIASTISGMPRCDVIVLGGEAIDTAFVRSAVDAIAQVRPIIILRSPHAESQVDSFRDIVTNLMGYRWLSNTDFEDAVVASANQREAIAVAWPIERQLPTIRSATDAAQQDLTARSDAPRPRFHSRDRSGVRPLQLRIPIDRVVATRGLWGLEQDETNDPFRWGGLSEKASLYLEIPWPGKFLISIDLRPTIPTMNRPHMVCMINGVAVTPTHNDGGLVVTANLFRHALVELIAPPMPRAPGDPRRLTCCIRGVGLQEIFP